MHDNRSISDILAGRQELFLSSVACYHDLTIFGVMIRCHGSYYKEQWMVVVAEEDLINHGRQHQGMDRPVDVVIAACISDDRGRWAVIAADASVGVSPYALA